MEEPRTYLAYTAGSTQSLPKRTDERYYTRVRKKEVHSAPGEAATTNRIVDACSWGYFMPANPLSFVHTSSSRPLRSKTAPRLECAADRLAASSPNLTAVRSIFYTEHTNGSRVWSMGKLRVSSEGCPETRSTPTLSPTESVLHCAIPFYHSHVSTGACFTDIKVCTGP